MSNMKLFEDPDITGTLTHATPINPVLSAQVLAADECDNLFK